MPDSESKPGASTARMSLRSLLYITKEIQLCQENPMGHFYFPPYMAKIKEALVRFLQILFILMKLVQTMSLENPCPRPKSTNKIKRSSVCCVHFCISNFINCWRRLELCWGLLTRLLYPRHFLSLQWSHLWSWLLLSLYLSSWLQTWCSSFGPDPQILKVASSWGKVIFPQFSSLKNFHVPLKS